MSDGGQGKSDTLNPGKRSGGVEEEKTNFPDPNHSSSRNETQTGSTGTARRKTGGSGKRKARANENPYGVLGNEEDNEDGEVPSNPEDDETCVNHLA